MYGIVRQSEGKFPAVRDSALPGLLMITLRKNKSFAADSERGFSGRRTYANSTLFKSNLEKARRKRVSNTLVYAQCHGAPDNVSIRVVVLLCINKKLCALIPNMLFCPGRKYQEQSIK